MLALYYHKKKPILQAIFEQTDFHTNAFSSETKYQIYIQIFAKHFEKKISRKIYKY